MHSNTYQNATFQTPLNTATIVIKSLNCRLSSSDAQTASSVRTKQRRMYCGYKKSLECYNSNFQLFSNNRTSASRYGVMRYLQRGSYISSVLRKNLRKVLYVLHVNP